MPTLSINLLGPPQLMLDDTAVSPSHHKAIALLAYLAVTRQPHTREALGALLWPDFDHSSARRELRRMLWALNKTLGKGWLAADRQQVALAESDDLSVDVHRLQAWLDECAGHGHDAGVVCAECEAPLTAVLHNYAAPFLDGFTIDDSAAFERWQQQERDRMQRAVAAAADKLLTWYAALRPLPSQTLIDVAHQQLALDPAHEPTHRLLTAVYILTRQPAQARRQIDAGATALADALDAGPSAAMQTIQQQVRQGTFTVTMDDLPAIFAAPYRVVTTETAVSTAGRRPSQPAIAPPHNLPAQVTPFVGRQAELAQLRDLLADPAARLISIMGPGGMGKTRLALELTQEQIGRFRDGVFFVELAPLANADNVAQAIADAINYPLQANGRSLDQQLADYLAAKEMLLLLDNFEHLLDALPLLESILKSAPAVTLLVTSRRRLGQMGETALTLGGMGFPSWSSESDAFNYAAIKLFQQTAQRARPDFNLSTANLPHVIQICRLVDGMPLGILLAASWITVLTPAEIEAELWAGLDILEVAAGELPPRQRSIRVVFDYSWGLMPPAEQTIFMKCALFRGGFSREAVHTITGATLHQLQALSSKSLIFHDMETGQYHLHELLRQYAAERLAQSPELAPARTAHLRFYLGHLAAQTAVLKGAEQLNALKTIETDFENIRAAWYQAVTQGDYDLLDTAVEAMYLFCYLQSRLEEGKMLFERARAGVDAGQPVAARLAVRFYGTEEDPAQLKERLATAVSQAEARGDRLEAAFCLHTLTTIVHYMDQDPETAVAHYEQCAALYRQIDEPYYLAHTLSKLGEAYQLLGQTNLTRQHVNEAYQLQQQIGDRMGASETLRAMSMTSFQTGRYRQSLDQLETSYELQLDTNFIVGQCSSHLFIGLVLYLKGECDNGRRRVEEGLRLAQEVVDYSTQAWCYATLSLFDSFAGDYMAARQKVAQAEAIETDPFRQTGAGNPFLQLTINWARTMLYLAEGDYAKAQKRLRPMLQLAVSTESQPYLTFGLALAAAVLVGNGRYAEAAVHLGLSRSQPAEATGFMDHWQMVTQLQRDLRRQLGDEAFQAAWQRGEQQDLAAAAGDFLAKLEVIGGG